MAEAGCPFPEFLDAGEWRSAVVCADVDLDALESDKVLSSAVDNSSDGEAPSGALAADPSRRLARATELLELAYEPRELELDG